jgi:diguanylate cyclase (GGDEF)-like protein
MEIEELAYFDPLTRLPNRRMFLNRMTQAIAGCERRGDTGALLFIDLDNFKTLNDTQGHDIGDCFLVQVADRLRRCVNPRDMVARIGGDEFVVVLEETGSEAAHGTLRAITTANQILSALNRPFELGPLRHVGSASVGVVVFDGCEKRADEILKRADIAMYQAKAAGRNSMALFDPATMDREAQRYRMLSDLRTAFSDNQLDLYFQPQVDHTGRVTGAEALVRWEHPTLGRIPPDEFVALAEQFGLNDELADFVFGKGMEALAGWQRDPLMGHLRLALNVSVQSFSSDGFIAMARSKIEAFGVDPTMLTFELTEHVMAKDHRLVAARMAEAKKLGVRLSLDDFGTGYSSLAYLKQLPFDEIKIDGGFVADIENSDGDRALVKTILAMARMLGLSAVAEHVENVRQEAFLRAFGCDFFQGFLYSPAMPADQFAEMFRALPLQSAASAPAMLQRA